MAIVDQSVIRSSKSVLAYANSVPLKNRIDISNIEEDIDYRSAFVKFSKSGISCDIAAIF